MHVYFKLSLALKQCPILILGTSEKLSALVIHVIVPLHLHARGSLSQLGLGLDNTAQYKPLSPLQ